MHSLMYLRLFTFQTDRKMNQMPVFGACCKMSFGDDLRALSDHLELILRARNLALHDSSNNQMQKVNRFQHATD